MLGDRNHSFIRPSDVVHVRVGVIAGPVSGLEKYA